MAFGIKFPFFFFGANYSFPPHITVFTYGSLGKRPVFFQKDSHGKCSNTKGYHSQG
jgi:hypothetical protein